MVVREAGQARSFVLFITFSSVDRGGCQNYGPFLGTLNIRCRIIIGTQKGTIILTTTHKRHGPAVASSP